MLRLAPLPIALLLVALAGCDAPIQQFERNTVYELTLAKSRSIPAETASRDAAEVVDELFGTPDQPRFPEQLLGGTPLVDIDRLARAAGPVSSGRDGTHRGLYREHCVVCHGLAGSGAGPASLFQNPYPRDFRHGIYKWKSTTRGAKPTRGDLRRLLERGIPGTAMPSYALLDDEDIEALVDYVIYLSIRGEVERRLAAVAIDDLGYEESAPEPDLRLVATGDSEGSYVVEETVTLVAARWRQAESSRVEVPEWKPLEGEAGRESIRRGKEIFHGQVVNCAGCHGPDGNGEMVTLDFDDWTKEYSTRLGLTPTDSEAMQPFRQAGAPAPRPIKARTLQDGVFQGGSDPETLYRRITQGIAGTPMPSNEVVAEGAGPGLTQDQVWDLVRYVRSISGVY